MTARLTEMGRNLLGGLAVALLLCCLAGAAAPAAQAQQAQGQTQGQDVSDQALTGGQVPGGALGSSSRAEFWREVRRGIQGDVSIPNKQAGVLVESGGESWREFRNGPLKTYGAWVVLGMVALLALFFVLRGRIRIEAGPSGRTIQRFDDVDRFAHWLTAVSFVMLALTGMWLLWGRNVLIPVIGPEAYALIAHWGKYAHNFLAFSFIVGFVLMFALWVGDNIPNRHDVMWLLKAGGLFSKHVHPHSRKFNAGQKIIFWAVMVGGISLALSGIGLLFPFETAMWGKTFHVLSGLGVPGLPADVTPRLEMQLNTVWHAAVGLVMIAIILAHIYIGSVGMEGAFAAMGSGRVDENWAREHHDLWVAEVEQKSVEQAGRPLPAE
ncbi:formate dehydrogenase gamma subunit [Tistlia consotensis]|uniref:Formate dehydrogenase gamma subunit n=1 Tax=Tistlia consotensis USBA 355 TaxID=560819 RepID=A0A1Y6BR82_9PROT|nr:formate dehydrogenase subunit gamma [Tistlia consotensis]SMF23925.1 formate dehydrogenase gamma subunit [Tistlia consotensis USBA 355]SNR61108.1 formate dehydrogenase gamma subunit [Tistlia consotensis]